MGVGERVVARLVRRCCSDGGRGREERVLREEGLLGEGATSVSGSASCEHERSG